MKEVSLYQEIFDELEGPVEDLTGEVSNSKLKSRSLKYETEIPKLEQMCYIMESVLLTKDEAEGTTVYAGFQKVSRAEDIWDRYFDLADTVDQIYLFGEDDATLKAHPNIDFIYLPEGHELTREWFLVIDQPLAKSMMVAYDLDGFGVYEDEKLRNFKGAKSNNPRVIKKAIDLLEDVIDSY
ncbi:putative sensor protein/domain protein [Halobacteroides halobius DSM 5150]|uniref:Putative sensor protein/domain protein n=1 Tax=Halobacteroides halobius (strain ATCC 35273 / DSM 5150 / MD-1) TaxID=748449 RepID=L0KB34_HALHC|nr:DICT sensory domain-containing protein [Halobacteroides halobius]AGB42226.1 putative sensor protein/domain protein [Halobacteroides halobius DSM 5150]